MVQRNIQSNGTIENRKDLMKKTGRELHEDLPLGDYPERPSVNQMSSKFYTDTHDILTDKSPF